jgi:hypothetical protein
VECEIEEGMAERWHKKLACFQKAHHSVVKKADTVTVSGTKIDYSLSPEDLV